MNDSTYTRACEIVEELPLLTERPRPQWPRIRELLAELSEIADEQANTA